VLEATQRTEEYEMLKKLNNIQEQNNVTL